MERNKKKQIVISLIYVTIFLVIVSWIYYIIRPVPNCFDGKQNQNEEGVDCAGVCAKKCEIKAVFNKCGKL